jgi:hypothetical protein
VARKKNKKRRWLFFRKDKSGSKSTRNSDPGSVVSALRIFMLFCIIAAVGVGFVWLEKYLKINQTGRLEVIDVPEWVNSSLEQKLYLAATADGENLVLDHDVARSVQHNISEYFPWLAEPRVQAMADTVRIYGRWRRPLVHLKLGLKNFYVDRELVILNYVSLPELNVPLVRGVQLEGPLPTAGEKWKKSDLRAAVTVVEQLAQMDRMTVPDNPLLSEIKTIDVANFRGRRNAGSAHIILYATDNTEIIWGAEPEKWHKHLEASDAEKLARLYEFYTRYGTLLTGVKYIDVRQPSSVPQPADKY